MLRMVDSLILLVLYVDDFLITSFSNSMIVAVKRIIHDMFLMTDMGLLHFFLGIEISQDASSIKLSQSKYPQDLLYRFHMTDCKSTCWHKGADPRFTPRVHQQALTTGPFKNTCEADAVSPEVAMGGLQD
jgi:hypothetical protein